MATICEKLGICDLNQSDIPVPDIKNTVFNDHYKELLEQVAKSKKMVKHKDDDFSDVQDYMKWKSVEQSRMAFRIRSEMVNEVRGNFKDRYRRKGGEDALTCQECPTGVMETQSHCVICPKWQDLRTGLELDKMDDLVTFFQRLHKEQLKGRTGSPVSAQNVSIV